MKNFVARLTAAVVVVLLVAACEQTVVVEPAAAAPDYAAELSPAVDAFISMWNTKDYDVLDAIMAADFQRHAPDQSVEGVEGMKEFIGQVHTAYPDFNIVIDESAYAEGLAFILWTVTGTHSGEGSVPATGRSVNVSGVTMLRFTDGMITDEVVHYDTATLQAQLEAEAIPHAE